MSGAGTHKSPSPQSVEVSALRDLREATKSKCKCESLICLSFGFSAPDNRTRILIVVGYFYPVRLSSNSSLTSKYGLRLKHGSTIATDQSPIRFLCAGRSDVVLAGSISGKRNALVERSDPSVSFVLGRRSRIILRTKAPAPLAARVYW